MPKPSPWADRQQSNPAPTIASTIASFILENRFGVKVLSSFERSPGLTGKDIDVILKVSGSDYEKLLDKEILTENLAYKGKPIDVFVTDGERVAVTEQVSPQAAVFTEKPWRLKRKLTISPETLRKLGA